MAVVREQADRRRDIDVEALMHWTIAAQKADRVMEAAWSPEAYRGGVSADGCFAVERYANLGTFVDHSGSAPLDSDLPLHIDAERVYETARDTLDAGALAIVVSCARTNTRPAWNPFPVIQYVVRGDMTNSGSRGRIHRGPESAGRPYCAVDCRTLDRGAELDHYRRLWLWWHDSLEAVQLVLAAVSLERWRLSRWRLPKEPWRA